MIIKFSRDLRGNALEKYKQTLNISPEQRDIIVGTLLGDASMSLRNGKPHYSIKFEQSLEHRHYVRHLLEVFESWCGTGIKVGIEPEPHKLYGKRIPKSVWFRTYSLKFLVFYYDYFYTIKNVTNKHGKTVPKGVKIIRKDIHKFLTARAVAYWFMDDGTYNTDRNSSVKSYLFSTQGFQKPEVERLCNALKMNFGIDSNINKDKDKWRIVVRQSSSQKFLDLIKPYIHSNFNYKL